MRRMIIALLVLVWYIGLAMSDDITPLEVTSKGTVFNYEDNTSGVGNFASYDKLNEQGQHSDARLLGEIAYIPIQRMDHGSGMIEREMILHSDNTINTNVSPDYNYGYSLAKALVSSNLVYGPQQVSIGTGYYAAHPVTFNSLLGDKTEIKNYASETSMDQETLYARAIKEDLQAGVEDDFYNAEWLPSVGLANTQMNLNESVDSGTAHVGMLQGDRAFEFKKSALYNSKIMVDEAYTGTFNLAIKMGLTIPTYTADESEDWLPCSCYKGWDDMNLHDQVYHSAKGFFDCTACPNEYAKTQCLKE